MKVITLENIKRFIEKKHGNQVISKINIKGDLANPIIICIHDLGTEYPTAYLNSNNELEFKDAHDKVHCILLGSDVKGLNKENPFIELEAALNGVLVIDGEVPSEEDLQGYIFRLDNHSAYMY